jgi:Tol biopolymer transport system component
MTMRTHTFFVALALVAVSSTVWTQQAASPPPRTMVWVDRSGAEQSLNAPPQVYSNPRISPDGRRLSVSIETGQAEHVWTCELPACGNLVQFTKTGTLNSQGIWTPDGQRLGFYSNVQGPQAAYWQAADGSGAPERLTPPLNPPVAQHLRGWSPNGQFGVMYHATPATQSDIYLLRMSDRVEFPFLATPAIEGGARYSPDGNWLAYMSTQSGGPQVYIQEMPGDRRFRQVSTDGGTQPIWNPKGGELFYRSGNRLMAVQITTGASFSVSQPRIVFDRQYWASPVAQTNAGWDVAPDGQRFLMIKESPRQGSN